MEHIIGIATNLWALQSSMSVAIVGYDIVESIVAKASRDALSFFIIPILALIPALIVAILTYKYFFSFCEAVLLRVWAIIRLVLLVGGVLTAAYITFLLILRLVTPFGDTIVASLVGSGHVPKPPPPPPVPPVQSACAAWMPAWWCQ